MAKRKSPPKKHARTRQRSLFGSMMRGVILLGLWGTLFVLAICAWYARELPDITKSASFELKTAITVKAADGTIIGRYGEVMGDKIGAAELPPHLVQAVLAIEDRRFYLHFGLDPLGLARAMFVNVKEGGFRQGGSTITQQLAKNLFLSQERTIKRKIQEAMLALWLEYELTKDEILSAYLNRVYMGSGTYGVDAAARLYFDKRVQDITLREAATLAGLLKAPSRYSPLNNPGLSKERTDTVITAMVDAGYVKKEDAESHTNLPPMPAQKPSGISTSRYYTDWVVDGLEDLIGTPTEDLIVETTMDTKIQSAAEEALLKQLLENGEARGFSQGAVVTMRPNGAVLAVVGGRDYALSQFNRATQGARQPGSSFKPIVFLAALEQGWEPDDLIYDGKFEEGRYRPQNFGGEYFGDVPLYAALMLSMNTATVRLMKVVGVEHVRELARRLGIISPLEADLSLALGSSGASVLEMTTAYSTIANGGMSVFPYAITKITSKDGNTLYYQRPDYTNTRHVVNTDNINMLKEMMRNVIEYGTGQRAKLPWPAAGKTGTSQESRDAWFIGFTDELVTGVWVGNDDNSPMKNVTGGSFPAAIWQEVMVKNHGRYAPVRFTNYSETGFSDLIGRITSGPQPEGFYEDAESGGEQVYFGNTRRINPESRYQLPGTGQYND